MKAHALFCLLCFLHVASLVDCWRPASSLLKISARGTNSALHGPGTSSSTSLSAFPSPSSSSVLLLAKAWWDDDLPNILGINPIEAAIIFGVLYYFYGPATLYEYARNAGKLFGTYAPVVKQASVDIFYEFRDFLEEDREREALRRAGVDLSGLPRRTTNVIERVQQAFQAFSEISNDANRESTIDASAMAGEAGGGLEGMMGMSRFQQQLSGEWNQRVMRRERFAGADDTLQQQIKEVEREEQEQEEEEEERLESWGLPQELSAHDLPPPPAATPPLASEDVEEVLREIDRDYLALRSRLVRLLQSSPPPPPPPAAVSAMETLSVPSLAMQVEELTLPIPFNTEQQQEEQQQEQEQEGAGSACALLEDPPGLSLPAMEREVSFSSRDGLIQSSTSKLSSSSMRSASDRRLFSKLDAPKAKKSEYTTFYSETKPSSPTARAVFSSSSSSSSWTAQPGSTVIEAFKDLQRKVKVMEEERYQACLIRDDLKARIALERRGQQSDRSRREFEAADHLLEVRTLIDARRREKDDLQSKMRTQQEIQESLERKAVAQQGLVAALGEDIDRQRLAIVSLEKKNLLLEKDLRNTRYRRQELDIIQQTSPQKHASSEGRLEEEVEELSEKILRMRKSSRRLDLHISSLQSYMDLLVRINGELIATLEKREAMKRDFLRTARSLSPPPRYAWPKDVHVGSVRDVLESAAEAQATALADQTALKATESVLRGLVQSLSLSPPPAARRSPSRSLSSSLHRLERAASRSPHTPSRSMAGSASASKRSPMTFRDLEPDQPQPLPTPSSASFRRSNRLEKEEEAEAIDPVPSSSSSSSEEEEESQSDESSGNESDYPPPAPAPSFRRGVMKKKSKKSQKKGGLQLSFSASRRDEALAKALARQGAVTNATRLAAAANAVSTTVRVSQTPTAVGGRRPSSAPPNRAAHTVSFIPSSRGGQASSEFNIIASVSKASRAASRLNATLASRVKSLHSGGAGRIFDEVPRITLVDLKSKLAAAKKLRESLG
eukprot:gene9465-10455_t